MKFQQLWCTVLFGVSSYGSAFTVPTTLHLSSSSLYAIGKNKNRHPPRSQASDLPYDPPRPKRENVRGECMATTTVTETIAETTIPETIPETIPTAPDTVPPSSLSLFDFASRSQLDALKPTTPLLASAAILASKERAERKYSRKDFELRKSEEKIKQLEQQSTEKLSKLKRELQEKLESSNKVIKEEMEAITLILRNEIDDESSRFSSTSSLMSKFESAVSQKRLQITSDQSIASEMYLVLQKLEPNSNMKEQMELLYSQKKDIITLEENLVKGLLEGVVECGEALKESKERSEQMKTVLNNMPQYKQEDVSYEWSEIERVQRVLGEVEEQSRKRTSKIKELKKLIESSEVSKNKILGGEDNKNIITKRRDKGGGGESNQVERGSRLVKPNHVVVGLEELNNKTEEEVVKVAASSTAKAFAGIAKTGVFGVKAALNAITATNVVEEGKVALKKGNEISKRVTTALSSNEGKDATKVITSEIGEGAKLAGGVVKTVIQNAKEGESRKEVVDAAGETTAALRTTLNAFIALAAKRIEERTGNK